MNNKFKETRTLVKKILEDYPETRDRADNILYIKVVETINREALNRPFVEVMNNLETLDIPPFETVRRTRQKLQQEIPELRACDKVQDYRTCREEEFRKEFGQW